MSAASETLPIIGFDTETGLITPETVRPPLVCGTFAGFNDSLDIVTSYIEAHDPDPDHVVLLTGDECVVEGVDWELLLNKQEALDFVLHCVDKAGRIVAHNATFDWGVVMNEMPVLKPLLASLLEQARIACSKVREMLYCIATDNFVWDGRGDKPRKSTFSLAHLAQTYWGKDLSADKNSPDAWRLRYIELLDIPAAQWPSEAQRYAISDASYALLAYMEQAVPETLSAGVVVRQDGFVVNEAEQLCADWVLQDMAAHGPVTDIPYIRKFESEVRAMVEKVDEAASEAGFWKINKCKHCDGTGKAAPDGWNGDPSLLTVCEHCGGLPHEAAVAAGAYRSRAKHKPGKNMNRLRAVVDFAFGGEDHPAKTPTGATKTDNDTLMQTGIKVVTRYAEYSGAKKLFDTYLPILYRGVESPILSRPNVLVRSGRTSWKDPNFQNPPAFGLFRECFVPRKGKVYASIDYSGVEMTTLAQVCLHLFGHSKMAEAINAGRDLHLVFAVHMLNAGGEDITYEEAVEAKSNAEHPLHALVKQYRQRAKAANFGFPGGLGAKAFRVYAQGYGLDLTLNEAEDLRTLWFSMWPEMADYFAMIGDASDMSPGGRFEVKQIGSGRVRGGCSYTSGANTLFQGLAADGAKAAMWALWKACNLDEGSPLFGVQMWAFIHDEFLFEGPEETAHLWAPEASRIMVEEMSKYTPDVKQAADPALMPRWLKKAAPAYVDGRLVTWYPHMVSDPHTYTEEEYDMYRDLYYAEDTMMREEWGGGL